MPERDLSPLSREDLEAEVRRLRTEVRAASMDKARQNAIFDSALDFAIVVTDREGIVTAWNSGAEHVMGWSAEEMRGQDSARFFTPEDRANGRPIVEMQLALRDGRAPDERWHLREGDERFWASGEMMPLRDEDGAHIGFVKIMRDRTAEHLAGKALTGAEASLRRAQKAGGVGLFTVDIPDSTLHPTPEFCRLYGLPVRDSYPSLTFEQLVIPEDAHLVSTAATRAQGDALLDVEYRIRCADTGELRWIARRGEIERDEAGSSLRFSGVSRDVTEQRAARDALAESEARYRNLFDTISEGFCIIRFIDGPLGPFGNYVHVEANPAFEHHLGIPHATGQTLRDIAPDEEAEGWLKIYGDVLRTGRPIRFEREFVPTRRHLEVSAHRVEPASRREVAVLFTDITARKQAEAALRASEAELRLVTNALPILVSFVDRSLTYRLANAAYEEWFGRAPKDVVGRTIPEIAGGRGYDVRRPAIERALAGESVQMDLNWPWPDGRRRIADIRYLPRRDISGAVDGFYIFVQDVTALRDAAAVMAERADILAREVAERTEERDLMWDTSPDLMLVVDFAGVFRRVNPAWTRLLGYAAEELVGHHVNEFVLPEDHAETTEAVADAAEGGQPRIINRYRHKDGSVRWISWVAANAGTMTYATGRDITAEKEQALALEATAEALRQSQKMEAVGQLTGGVAHDFNNLLTIIRSSVDFLRRPDLPEERRKRYMDAVSDTVDRAAKLTGQLLAFARRQALKPEVLNVGDRLRAVADMLDTVTGARVQVLTELPDTPCFIRADQSQFETALINMAVNARDAMDGAGTLTLRLSCGGSIPPIRGHGGGLGLFARIEMSDTGSGIAPGDLARIFEPFFTTKEVGKGTGLGLSQVFGFAKQSGGDVDVTSQLGRGTMFTLYLPEVEAQTGQETADEDGGLAPDGRGLRVLVVEDNIEVGKFATQILEDLGYQTEWVANAETAIERLGPNGDGFDAVFSDVVMPGMGGIALAEELRRRLPTLPVVLASGYSHVLSQDSAHGFELLHKPYSADQLSRVLRRVTNNGRRRKSQ